MSVTTGSPMRAPYRPYTAQGTDPTAWSSATISRPAGQISEERCRARGGRTHGARLAGMPRRAKTLQRMGGGGRPEGVVPDLPGWREPLPAACSCSSSLPSSPSPLLATRARRWPLANRADTARRT